jgi:hypothetical protein
MKVVLNKCYGGFGLSTEAVKMLIKKNSPLVKKMPYLQYTGGDEENVFGRTFYGARNWKSVGDGFYVLHPIEHVLYDESGTTVWADRSGNYENRSHPDLIEVVETLGKAANGPHAELEIAEIPDSVDWEIDDYDGIETAHEKHASW